MAKQSKREESREMLTPEEIDQKIEEDFNPVKPGNGETPKESEMKKTQPYDRARLEFLRMIIGSVQNFYTTLGNILLGVSERLANVEARLYTAELKGKMQEEYLRKMQEEYALLIARESRFVSMEEFKLHWEKLEKEKQSESNKL